MSDRLVGVREKLLRASEHLTEFEREVTLYAATRPYSVTHVHGEPILEKTQRRGDAWRIEMPEPPPLRLAVIAGDVVHNLRSASDHLARELVLANGGEPAEGPGGTTFPIISNPRTGEGRDTSPVRIVARLGGASDEANNVVDALQPFNSTLPDRHPLAILQLLSNADKHRVLNVVELDLGVKFELPALQSKGSATRRGVRDGTLVHWILEENPEYRPQVEATHEMTPMHSFADARALGDRDPLPATDLLIALSTFVRDDVVQRFAEECFGKRIEFPA